MMKKYEDLVRIGRTKGLNPDRQTEFDCGKAVIEALVKHGRNSPEFMAGMLDEFSREHRTNQQSVVRAIVDLLSQWITKPDDPYGEPWSQEMMSDPRNEGAYQVAKLLRERVGSDIFLPFV